MNEKLSETAKILSDKHQCTVVVSENHWVHGGSDGKHSGLNRVEFRVHVMKEGLPSGYSKDGRDLDAVVREVEDAIAADTPENRAAELRSKAEELIRQADQLQPKQAHE